MKKILILTFWVSAIYTNAQQNLIQSTGNVGIGTTSPATKLNIISSLNDGIRLDNGTNYGHIFNDGNLHIESVGNLWINANSVSPTIIGGNVGIGTGVPVTKLDVNGGISRGGQPILYGNSGDSYANIRVIQNVSATVTDGMYINYNSTGGSSADLRFYANGTTERMRISASSGNVGIGTGSPTQKLDVQGNIIVSSKIGLNNDIANYYIGGITNGMEYRPYSVGKFNFTSGNGTWLFENGNVGIGTSDPGTYKLAVNGSIKAKEVKVSSLNWADFVFANEYQLPPLSEVETFIKANKHLPEMPSEKEVLEKGINLGEMNAKLLQKIEELTLYLIEQGKKNDVQSEQINQLEKEIKELKSSARK